MAPRKSKTFNFPHPMENTTLVGHADAWNNFIAAWNNRDVHPIHPVWILAGPRGIGKATFAYNVAKMVYGNIGDFFIIDVANNIDERGNKKEAKKISVHTVRLMIERMQMSSMSGDWRVVLIDSVDELSTTAANAILKLLEEPPAKTLFLLVVHQLSNVLPTIRSRARVEKMHPLTISQLQELCLRFLGDDDVSDDTLKLANGSFGRIANLKKSGGDAIYADLIEYLKNSYATQSDAMSIAKRISTEPALHGILLDAIASFGLADLYPAATRAINNIATLNLEPSNAIFKIIMEIKKCL